MITLRGIPACPGIRIAKARWILRLAEVKELAPGEIMLTRMTSPDWIEAFERICGIATEQGGALCHAAVVAREMNIPTVVGVGPDLRSIKTGDIIRLDGNTGCIVLE